MSLPASVVLTAHLWDKLLCWKIYKDKKDVIIKHLECCGISVAQSDSSNISFRGKNTIFDTTDPINDAMTPNGSRPTGDVTRERRSGVTREIHQICLICNETSPQKCQSMIANAMPYVNQNKCKYNTIFDYRIIICSWGENKRAKNGKSGHFDWYEKLCRLPLNQHQHTHKQTNQIYMTKKKKKKSNNIKTIKFDRIWLLLLILSVFAVVDVVWFSCEYFYSHLPFLLLLL